MPFFTKTTKLYQEFRRIDENAHHTMVRFYEANAQDIISSKFDIYFEILVNYAHALFEIGAYSKHIKAADELIKLSIQYNIQFYNGEDIYYKSLFQKAAALYNLMQYQKAKHIIQELIKIDPYHSLAIRFLQKCLHKIEPSYWKTARASAIALFLLTTVLIAIDVLFVLPFMPQWADFIEYFRWSIFSIGILVLGGTYLFHYLQTRRQVIAFVEKARRAKG